MTVLWLIFALASMATVGVLALYFWPVGNDLPPITAGLYGQWAGPGLAGDIIGNL